MERRPRAKQGKPKERAKIPTLICEIPIPQYTELGHAADALRPLTKEQLLEKERELSLHYKRLKGYLRSIKVEGPKKVGHNEEEVLAALHQVDFLLDVVNAMKVVKECEQNSKR